MSVNNYKYALALVISLFISQNSLAQQNLWGSGFFQGGMSCPYETKVSKAAVSMSDEEKEERQKIKELKADLKLTQLEKKRADKEVEYLRKKIERNFDSSVVDFLLNTHIEGAKTCDSYRAGNPRCNPKPVTVTTTEPVSGDAPKDQAGATRTTTTTKIPELSAEDKTYCDGLSSDVPELLKNKWNSKESSGRGNYCIGDSKSNAGSVHSSICSDTALRPQDVKGRSYNASDCARSLAEYRKKRIALANAADKEERIKEEISDRTYAITDARERAKIDREYRQALTEAECEDCDRESRGYSYQKPKRDWMSTLVNVGAGFGLMYMGKRAEDAANEYNAQAGWPSQSSYGFPFYAAGSNGVINGLVGPGAYGCSGGYGGAGFPFGSGGAWNLGGAANGAFGPFAGAGGAFGYPQGMFGSPWGGGMYNPGFGVGGQMNGPFGGFNFGGPFGFPNNGNMALCITAPCNPGGGQFGGPFGGPFGMPQMGGQFGGPFGMPPFGGQLGGQFGMPPMGGQLGGQFGMQYQMQMLQMQQQMQQQYYQQQQQYYQAQMQQQMQMAQRQQQAQQQAMQIQMQMAQLNMQLQQLYQQNYYGGAGLGVGAGFQLGGSIGFGGYGGSFSIGAPNGSYPGGPGMGLPGVPGGLPGGTPGFYPPVGAPYNPYPGAGTGTGTGTGRGR